MRIRREIFIWLIVSTLQVGEIVTFFLVKNPLGEILQGLRYPVAVDFLFLVKPFAKMVPPENLPPEEINQKSVINLLAFPSAVNTAVLVRHWNVRGTT